MIHKLLLSIFVCEIFIITFIKKIIRISIRCCRSFYSWPSAVSRSNETIQFHSQAKAHFAKNFFNFVQ